MYLTGTLPLKIGETTDGGRYRIRSSGVIFPLLPMHVVTLIKECTLYRQVAIDSVH